MIAVFSGNKRSSELNSATADLQESARYGLEQISRDARIAGYAGCLRVDSPNAVNVIAKGSPTTSVDSTVVTGTVVDAASTWFPALPGLDTPVINRSKPGTHVLMLQYGGPDSSALSVPMLNGGLPNPSVEVHTFQNPGLQVGDLALVTNCEFGDLFRVSSVGSAGTDSVFGHSAITNKTGAFSRAYGGMATIGETKVMKFHSNVYYVGENGQFNESGQPIYSLYQQSLPYDSVSNPAVELITGVENFRVSYGVRNKFTGGVRYVSANDPVFNPESVDSIRIGILMVSYDEVADIDDSNTYFIAGHSISPIGNGVALSESHPGDRRLRLAFTTTVTIRNRRGL